MNFFFDNNMAHKIADMIAAFCQDSHTVIHITKHEDFVPNNIVSPNGKIIGNNTSDIEWIQKLGASGKDWKIISSDMDIIDTAHERAALLESGLTFFACDHIRGKIKAAEQAWKIVKLWDEIVRNAETPGPSLYRLRTGKHQCVEVIRSGMRARGGKFKS